MAKAAENRFEVWLNEGRFSRLVLILVALAAWLLCDYLLAIAYVRTGHAKAEDFFLTSLPESLHTYYGDVPELRDLLANHPRLYAHYTDRFQADGLLGVRLVPNFLIILPPFRSNGAEFSDANDKPYWFMTDERGFPPVTRVGHHYLMQKPADVFRVIMLGGSTVEGIGVRSPLESLPSKLQMLLEREVSQSSRRVEVINGGISTFASDQEYLLLIADLLRFEPDLVIAYDGWNDAVFLPARIAGDPRTRPYRTEPQQVNEDRVNASFTALGAFRLFATITAGRTVEFLNRFATFRLLHHAIILITSDFHRKDGLAHPKSAYRPELSVEAARVYIDNRERMLFIAKQKGFQFASFLQPIMGIDGKSYSAIESDYARRYPVIATDEIKQQREVFYETARPLLQKFAGANEVPGTSCVADISTTSFAGVSATVYADSGHLLANGNELVARRILAELRRCKLLPQ